MEVRKLNRLPEVHYSYAANPRGQIVNTYVDAEAIAFARLFDPWSWSYLLEPYESKQPPLYYVTAGVASHLAPPNPREVFFIGRIVSALFGAATVFFIWATAREIAPRHPTFALGAAGVIALLPQFTFCSATLSNDSAINFASSLTIFLLVRGLRRPAFDPWMLWAGVGFGLAVLAKLWAVALVPAAALVWLFRVFEAPHTDSVWRERLKRGARMALGATLGASTVGGWWLVRNIFLYGEPTGSQGALRYDGQFFKKLVLGSPGSVDEFVFSTWTSFWGRFGWMDRYLHADFYEQARYVTLVLVMLTAMVALLYVVRWLVLGKPPQRHVWQSAFVLIVLIGANVFAYIQFSLQIAFQGQSRYLFPALTSIAIVLTGGLTAVSRNRLASAILFGGLFLWLAYMNVSGLLSVGRPY